MLDYIVVGFGLAGLSFVEELEKNDKSYIVFEDSSQKSSRVAGGLYNPVILKRFTAAWNASAQLKKAVSFYKNIEVKLQEPIIHKLPILRRFNSVEEQNRWFEACDNPVLNEFLSPALVRNTNKALDIPFHYGKVLHTGKIKIQTMLSSYSQYLENRGAFVKKSFDYNAISLNDNGIVYQDIKAKNIVFAEGFGVKNNPYFNYLPLVGNKGEYIIIRSEKLKIEEAVKSSIFIIPLGDNLYKVGATYNNWDKSKEISSSARKEIENKLKQVINVKYEVVDQMAGIRPTVKDRRPLIGSHPSFKNLHIINGLGSRGILIGPTIAKNLYDCIERGIDLDEEIDIKRFEKLR